MSIAAGAVMVGASVLCLGGAVRTRRSLEVAAALIMLAAMIDHAFFETLSPVVWAAALVVAGLMLGMTMRWRRRSPSALVPVAGQDSAVRPVTRMCHRIELAAALAYPAMAWLLLAGDHSRHQGFGEGTGGGGTAGGAHAHGAVSLVSVAPVLAAAGICLVLTWFGVRALRRRHWAGAVEAGAMTAMLCVMFAV